MTRTEELVAELKIGTVVKAQEKSENIHFYKIEFAAPDTTFADVLDGADSYTVAIRGTRAPTPEEAKDFLWRDFFT